MPENPSHRHHYTPCFYTKRWANRDGKVCVYTRPWDRVVDRWKHPSAFGYKDRLNTTFRPDGTPETKLETQVFTPIDTRANEAVEHIIRHPGKALNRELRSGFTRLILSLLYRHPTKIEELRQGLASDVKSRMEEVRADYVAGKDIGLPKGTTLDEAIAEIRRDALEQGWASIVANLLSDSLTGNHIMNMLWHVRQIQHADHTLLTGDQPVIHYNGISKPDGHIALALSPQYLFFATNNRRVTQNVSYVSDSFLVGRFNHEIARLAIDFVCGDSTSHAAFVQARLKRGLAAVPFKSPKPTMPSQQWYIPVAP